MREKICPAPRRDQNGPLTGRAGTLKAALRAAPSDRSAAGRERSPPKSPAAFGCCPGGLAFARDRYGTRAASPPLRVPSCRQTCWLIVSLTDRVEPSISATPTSPLWWLREVIAAKVFTVALFPSCCEL